MSQKNSGGRGILSTLLGLAVLVIGFLIYIVTGVDFFGVLDTTAPADPTPIVREATGDFVRLDEGLRRGASSGFWQLYFTTPANTRDRSQYQNGADVPVAAAIDAVRNTLDIAVFELNNERITEAIIDAHDRGVRVRVVTDDEHGLEDDDSTIVELELAGIPIVDDNRTGLMHNKFMIMDGLTVWTGSMNYTVNGVYRNNNNILALRSRRLAEVYQEEFDEMFVHGEFGITSDPSNTGDFVQDGVPLEVYYASENQVIASILREINNASSSIRFMTFSFTRDDVGMALLEASRRGVDVQGMFETVGSETVFSEMPRLYCAGIDVRQDGNNGILHHKVFVIDERVVLTGSFNFSNNAVESNDENLLVIRDGDIAALYLEEFSRLQAIGRDPGDDLACN